VGSGRPGGSIGVGSVVGSVIADHLDIGVESVAGRGGVWNDGTMLDRRFAFDRVIPVRRAGDTDFADGKLVFDDPGELSGGLRRTV
jgi:hypothetical protein